MNEVMHLHALINLYIQRRKSCLKQKHKKYEVSLIKIVDYIDQGYIGI